MSTEDEVRDLMSRASALPYGRGRSQLWAEAAALAEKKLTELEQTQLGQAEIRERVLTGRTEGNTFLVEAHYLVLEDAALERQFEVNQ